MNMRGQYEMDERETSSVSYSSCSRRDYGSTVDVRPMIMYKEIITHRLLKSCIITVENLLFNHRVQSIRKISMISELALSQDDYTIKVRVIRLWRQTSWNQQLRMIGMILMDEMGSKIECNVDKPFASLQGKSFEEYGDYYIHKPTLGLNEGVIKFVDGPHKLYFQYNTKITKCIDFCEPQNSFDFADFQQLHDNAINPKISFAYGHFVLLIQCAKLKLVRDRPYVNNTYLATKLYIEDDIEEITTFKKSLQAKKGSLTSSVSRTSGSSIMYSLHDDFLQKNSFHQISAIHELNESKVQIVKVSDETVNGLDQLEEKEIMVCTNEKCKDKLITAEPSFMIKVRVQGLVGVVSLTIFDREVRNIMKLSAADLLSKYERFGNTSQFPIELNAMIDKKLAFKIIVKTFNVSRFGRSYNISKITDNVDIISALEKIEKKSRIEQDMDTESVNIIGSEFASQETVGCKDDTSHTADNTHVSNIPSGISSRTVNNLNSPPTSAKRKLVDVYDLDDDVYESTTKPNAPRIGDGKVGGTTKLLIPKVEK
ncbi:unnamed protein product [Lactuca virosa]|uniref:Replication protein A 70 kDa DNA-binding subunit B/D first OB fold domain-containing protein n=1 Tax=Lactuca virosa TaxID=75947 RepID=A0AAU9N0C6_9ASTR|nr:unnamed protein product [Lactuca virosa]